MTALFDIKTKEGQHEEADKRIKSAISGTSGNLFSKFKQAIEGNKSK